MRCDEFEILWQQQLDDRQDPQADAELCAHAAVCSSCQDLLDFYQPLVEGLRADAGVDPATNPLSDDFVVRVMDRVAATEAAQPTAALAEPPFRFSPARQAGWLAITAALLLAGFAITQSDKWNEQGESSPASLTHIDSPKAEVDPQPNLAQEGAVSVDASPEIEIIAETPQSEPVAPLPEVPAPDADPLSPSELADNSPTSIADESIETGYPSVVETLQYVTDRLPGVSPESAADSTRTVWLEEVTGGLKPLAGSVSGAWNALKQTLPMRKEPSIEKPQAGRRLHRLTEAWS